VLRGCYLPLTNNGFDRMTIKPVAKFCSVAAMLLVVIAALGPTGWQPRSGLGWQIDHFVGAWMRSEATPNVRMLITKSLIAALYIANYFSALPYRVFISLRIAKFPLQS
jgi:hypothetical protein